MATLVDDLHQELDRGSRSLLVLLDLTAVNTNNCSIFLPHLSGTALGNTVLQWVWSFVENSESGAGEILFDTLATGIQGPSGLSLISCVN